MNVELYRMTVLNSYELGRKVAAKQIIGILNTHKADTVKRKFLIKKIELIFGV